MIIGNSKSFHLGAQGNFNPIGLSNFRITLPVAPQCAIRCASAQAARVNPYIHMGQVTAASRGSHTHTLVQKTGVSPVRRHWRAQQRDVSVPEGGRGDPAGVSVTYIHLHVYTYTYTFRHIYMHRYIDIRRYITCGAAKRDTLCKGPEQRTNLPIYVNTCILTYIYMYIYIHTHLDISICIDLSISISISICIHIIPAAPQRAIRCASAPSSARRASASDGADRAIPAASAGFTPRVNPPVSFSFSPAIFFGASVSVAVAVAVATASWMFRWARSKKRNQPHRTPMIVSPSNPRGVIIPEGGNIPEGGTIPEGSDIPEGVKIPEGGPGGRVPDRACAGRGIPEGVCVGIPERP